MGIEPTMPLLAQSIIGFEDRGRHQSGTRFQGGSYTEIPDYGQGMMITAGCEAGASLMVAA